MPTKISVIYKQLEKGVVSFREELGKGRKV